MAEAGLSPQATRNFIVVDSSVTQALANTNMDLIIRTGKAGKPNSSKVLLKTAQKKTAVGTTGDQKTANGQVEGDPAVLAGMTVDDEDDWRSRSVEGQAVSAPPPPVPLPNDHPLRELVTAILEGRMKDGASVKPELWERYGLDKLVREAEGERQNLHALREAIRRVRGQNNGTLGREFWQENFREALRESLRATFDGFVIREELHYDGKPNPSMPPAPIRLHDNWNGQPAYQRCRRMAPKEEEVCRAMLQELLEKGLITESASPWGAPVLLVPKPGSPGKWRMCIDYRRLNELTVADRWPLPDPDETVAALAGSASGSGERVYSCFDLCSGFYNVPIY